MACITVNISRTNPQHQKNQKADAYDILQGTAPVNKVLIKTFRKIRS
jgi:hypothetical protein